MCVDEDLTVVLFTLVRNHIFVAIVQIPDIVAADKCFALLRRCSLNVSQSLVPTDFRRLVAVTEGRRCVCCGVRDYLGKKCGIMSSDVRAEILLLTCGSFPEEEGPSFGSLGGSV